MTSRREEKGGEVCDESDGRCRCNAGISGCAKTLRILKRYSGKSRKQRGRERGGA